MFDDMLSRDSGGSKGNKKKYRLYVFFVMCYQVKLEVLKTIERNIAFVYLIVF